MPRALLDTHSFLWFVTANPKLSTKAERLISAGATELLLSVASIWEIAIKVSTGRLPIPEPLDPFILDQLRLNRIGVLQIMPAHALRAGTAGRDHPVSTVEDGTPRRPPDLDDSPVCRGARREPGDLRGRQRQAREARGGMKPPHSPSRNSLIPSSSRRRSRWRSRAILTSRSTSFGSEIPESPHRRGYMEMLVKPGRVFTSLT